MKHSHIYCKYILLLLIHHAIFAFEVHAKQINDELLTAGRVSTSNQYDLTLPFNAEHLTQIVPFGEQVERNTPLFKIHSSSLKLELIKAMQQYSISVQQLQLKHTKVNANQELLSLGAISKKAWEEDQISYLQNTQTVQENNLKLEQLLTYFQLSTQQIQEWPLHNLQQFNEELERHDAYILSPDAGTLLKPALAHEKQLTKDSIIASVIPADAYTIDVTADEYIIDKIEVGQAATIKLLANNKSYSGYVKQVVRQPISNTNPAKYHVLVQPDDTTAKFVLGMHAHVTIYLDQIEGIYIPLKYILRIDNQDFVKCLRNKKTELVAVKLGQTHKMEVHVTEGLKAGDEIIETS